MMSTELIALTSAAMLAGLSTDLCIVPECKTTEKHPSHKLLKATAFMPIYNNTRRNSDCPCGSTKKFKKCCRGKSIATQ